jgi:hypothetical protein
MEKSVRGRGREGSKIKYLKSKKMKYFIIMFQRFVMMSMQKKLKIKKSNLYFFFLE